MKKTIGFLFLSLVLSVPTVTAAPAKKETPKQAEKVNWQRVLHIARSLNSNICAYDVGVSSGADGKTLSFETEIPVHVYWVLYEKKGKLQELTALEEKMAYGVKVTQAKPDRIEFIVKPMPKKPITVKLYSEGGVMKPRAVAQINGEDCFVTEIFIKSKSSIPLPKVVYIDLKGISEKTGKEATERITK
jgi:hypothetical protein